ncbi:retrovirus-related pol polyprotein from transposon TNT 1-94 [Tanacetum coccineum]|uniref:Retrovirus-related pol polyprotein from transposon TNT 1-94 n=1 Tax=Tanacetum coccineum TaxID=301880 RepID=A0ABQ4YS11_9ASTR
MAAVEVPQTLEYRGGQLNAAPVLELEGQWTADERKAANLDQRLKSLIMSVLLDDQMNSVINCLTAKSTWDDLILYHEGLSDVKESRVMDPKLCYNTFKFKEGESPTQTFTRYKALMNELVNDGIKLSKLEINTGFINRLPKKWLSFCQSLRNTNHVKDSELASLFGKLKYEENLIDNIYETEKSKSLVSATPLSTAFLTTSIVQDFQDRPDDEEDTRSNHEYLNNLEEEYQARALLAKSKRFFKKGTQRFSSAKATDQTECHKYGKKGHFARDCWSKTSIPSYQSPSQPKLLHSSEHKPEPRRTKDLEAKYNKVKAKLALLSSSTSAPSSSLGKNKGLIAEMYDWDEEEVSSDDNEVTEVKALMELTDEERVSIGKESANNGEWVKISIQKCISEQIPTQKKKILGIDQLTEDTSSSGLKDPVLIKSSVDNSEMSITGNNKPKLSGAKDFTLSNHDTVTDYDSADESSICSTPLPPLEKLSGVEPVSRPKTIKSILKSKSTFKDETLKGITINEPSLAPVRGKKVLQLLKLTQLLLCKRTNHRTCDHADFMSSIDINQYHTSQSESSSRSRPSRPAMPFPSYIHCGYNDHQYNDCVYYPICEICGSYDHDTHGHNKIISLKRGIKPRNPQHITKNCEICGSNVHTTSDHNDIEWFRKREALRSKTHTKRSLNSYPLQMEDTSAYDPVQIPFNKRGTWYLNGTPSLGLQYPKSLGLDLKG